MIGRVVASAAFLLVMTSLPSIVASDKDSYRVRVRVYADKAGVDKFQYDNPGRNLTEHVEQMVVVANRIYTSLLPSLNVTLLLEQFIPLKINIFKNVLRNIDELAIYYDETGYEFWEWTRGTYDPKIYDIAILLTGFDMYSRYGSSSMFGHGYVGSACSENGVGAVEMTEPMGTIGFAHEIGHILGAEHDSEAPKSLCTKDTYEYGNLMNKYTKFDSPLRFKFSQCSVLQISEKFKDLTDHDENCLLIPGDHNDSVPILQTTADQLCESRLGQGWTMHRHYTEYGDDFCENFDCVKLDQDRQRKTDRFDTPDGLGCGKSKRCYKRKCVYVTNGDSNMTDACPWGSQGDAYVTPEYGYPCSTLGCGGYSKMCCGHCTR